MGWFTQQKLHAGQKARTSTPMPTSFWQALDNYLKQAVAAETPMALAQVVVIAIALLVGTVFIHYEALRLASGMVDQSSSPSRTDILKVIAILLGAHFVEIGLYAGVLLLCQHLGLGALAGEIEGDAIDWLYFSISSYTTLGVGDLHPRGPLRLVAGVEALNGLVLIGWSASFTYLTMEQVWKGGGGEKMTTT